LHLETEPGLMDPDPKSAVLLQGLYQIANIPYSKVLKDIKPTNKGAIMGLSPLGYPATTGPPVMLRDQRHRMRHSVRRGFGSGGFNS